MNSQGYTKDNTHKGNTKIVAGGIDVDGLIRVGDQSVGGNGYVLPAVKGTEGQVITMNADNTTSFQPIPAPVATAEKPIQNLFTMLTPRTSYTIGNADPYFLTASGSEIVDTTNFEVGDVIRVRVEGYYVNNATNPNTSPCTITHQWFIDMPNTSPSNETLSSPVQFFGSGGNWFNEVIITWESASSVRITFNGKINYNTGGAVSDEVRALNWFVGGSAPPGTERPKSAGSPYYIYPPPANLWIRGQNRTDIGDGYAIATNYYMDKMNVNAFVAGGGSGGTSDHLLLSNLNGGPLLDGGHTNMFVISGAKPMLGNINMNNNNITNTSIISGSNGDLDFTGTETHLNSNNDLHLEAASNFNTEVRIQGNGEFKVLHGGGDRFSVANNLITANRAISMDNNDIDDIRNLANISQGISINFGTLVPNRLQILSSDTIIRDISSGNAIDIDSNRIIIDGQVGNTQIRAFGADVELTCNNLNLQGASSINNDKIAMNNTLTEHPIIVYLPALLADFPDPVKNLLVKINSSGNIQPIAYGDPDSTGVVGTTHEIVVADGLVPVQVGGICSFTPAPTLTINAGTQLEKTNTGVPTIFGCVQPSNGVGTCAVALTGGTGATDGSIKILGLWQKNEHF